MSDYTPYNSRIFLGSYVTIFNEMNRLLSLEVEDIVLGVL